MIIDAHTHLGKKSIVATAAELVASMDQAGIDKSLVFAGKFMENATSILLDDIAPYKGRLYGIGSVSPLARQVGQYVVKEQDRLDFSGPFLHQLEKMFQEKRLHGMKFYPGYEHFYPDEEILYPIYKMLIHYDRPAIFHSGDLFNGQRGAKLKYAHPLQIDDLAVEFPKLKIVIAHMGYPWVLDAAEVCYKNENVFTDCSGLTYGHMDGAALLSFARARETFFQIVDSFDKVIFGTDWPIAHQDSYVETCARYFSPNVMGETAQQLFGID